MLPVRLARDGALVTDSATGTPVLEPVPLGQHIDVARERFGVGLPVRGRHPLVTTVWLVPGGASIGTASHPTGPPLGPIPQCRPSGVLKKTP